MLTVLIIVPSSGLDTLQASCVDGDIRLVNGSSPLEGRVEICMNNAWGTVCNNSFSSSDAEVVCTQLGYRFNGSSVLAPSEFSQGSGPIFLDRVSCEGGEERVLDCQQAPIGLHTCTHQQDTGVKCIGKYVYVLDLYMFSHCFTEWGTYLNVPLHPVSLSDVLFNHTILSFTQTTMSVQWRMVDVSRSV